MLEVVEGIRFPVCRSAYVHYHMIDFDCEVVIPLNSDPLRYHQIHQNIYT